MAAGTTVPVVNALSDDFHPCQLLADLLTIREKKGTLAGLSVAFVGDGRSNMGQSYLLACATAGMHVRIGAPEGFLPEARRRRRRRGDRRARPAAPSVVTTDATEAVAGVDVVVTDTWVSMGKEDEKAQRVAVFGSFKVDQALMAQAEPTTRSSCTASPPTAGTRSTADVIDGPSSVIWDEAENRLHAQKALLTWLLAH